MGKYYQVVLEIYHRPQSIMTGTELFQLVDQIKSELFTEESDWIVKRLKQLRVVVGGAGEEDQLQLALPVRQWLDFLLEHAEPVSEDSIRAHHTQQAKLICDLRTAIHEGDRTTGRQVVQELSTLHRRFVADVEMTHTAVLKETLEVKNARDKLSTQEKFIRINRLYQNYVEPIRRIVSIDGEMEASFDELEGLALRANSAAFFLDPTIPDQITTQVGHARLTARIKLEECAAEVEPLFRRLRRETQILTGASRALAAIYRHGFTGSGLSERLNIVSFRIHRHYSDRLVGNLLEELLGSAPVVAPSLDAPAGEMDDHLGQRRSFDLPGATVLANPAALSLVRHDD